MGISSYSSSQSFFEIASLAQEIEGHSFRGRLLCLQDFLKKLGILPFALAFKAFKTFFRALGVFWSAGLILITLGFFSGIRNFFVERVSALAKDLADWILLPFALLSCFCKLILAFLIHPSFYFKY